MDKQECGLTTSGRHLPPSCCPNMRFVDFHEVNTVRVEDSPQTLSGLLAASFRHRPHQLAAIRTKFVQINVSAEAESPMRLISIRQYLFPVPGVCGHATQPFRSWKSEPTCASPIKTSQPADYICRFYTYSQCGSPVLLTAAAQPLLRPKR